MSRRKKDPPPRSVSWESYRPDDGMYWRLGGPFVPIDQIPPATYNYGDTASHMKRASRIKYLDELIRKAEEDLAEAKAYYLELEGKGIDAMKFPWYRDQDRQMDDSGDWLMVARNVDRHRASSYRSIAMYTNKLLSYRAELARLEAEGLPLLFGRS